MSTHLSAEQLASLGSGLRSRRCELEGRIADELGGGTRPEHAREVLLQEGHDAMARDADREVDLARSDQELSEMRAVNDALARLQSPQFGLCIDCGAEIPFERLRLGPQVLRCVGCQTKHEASDGHASRTI